MTGDQPDGFYNFAKRIDALKLTQEQYATLVGVAFPSVRSWCGVGNGAYPAPVYAQRQLTAFEDCPKYFRYMKQLYLKKEKRS